MTLPIDQDTRPKTGTARGRTPSQVTQSRALMATVLAFLAIIALAIWLTVQARTSRPLDLAEIGRLAAAGKYDQALVQVEASLRTDPSNAWSRLMAAELALDTPIPQPERSLEHLGQLRSNDPVLRAKAKLAEGKALYSRQHYDQAEECWLEALRQDPKVPEAAWALLDLYYLEGRHEESRHLALRQHQIEPDPRDRVRFLVEIIRMEAEPPDPSSIVARFEPAVRGRQADLHVAMALGLAQVHSSLVAEGLETLSTTAARFPENAGAWDALLSGLDAAGQSERLADSWEKVPAVIRKNPRFSRHEGNVAQARGDWAAAAAAYHRARSLRPDDLTVAYRLARALHALGRHDQAADCDRFVQIGHTAQERCARYSTKRSSAIRDLGLRADPALYEQLAENRERLGRLDEARAWRHLTSKHAGP